MVPKPRKPGQTGGWGGQFTNRGSSVSRGGSPSKGGAGGGKTPNKGGGCVVWAVLILSIPAVAAIYGAAQLLA